MTVADVWFRTRAVSKRSPLVAVAPFCAAFIFVFLPWMPVTSSIGLSEEMLVRNEQIAQAIADAPWVINDRWSGRPVTVPSAAIQILRPTAILSRQYRAVNLPDASDELNGTEVVFSVVHCTDMRDMRGHFPPVCYPAHGWRILPERTRTLRLDSAPLGDGRITAYEFSVADDQGERRIRSVLNFFVMPDGQVSANMDRLTDMASHEASARMGVAQVQLVIDDSLDDRTSIHVLRELVDGMPKLFSALGGTKERMNDVQE